MVLNPCTCGARGRIDRSHSDGCESVLTNNQHARYAAERAINNMKAGALVSAEQELNMALFHLKRAQQDQLEGAPCG